MTSTTRTIWSETEIKRTNRDASKNQYVPATTKAQRTARAAQSETCIVCGQSAAARTWAQTARGAAHFTCAA